MNDVLAVFVEQINAKAFVISKGGHLKKTRIRLRATRLRIPKYKVLNSIFEIRGPKVYRPKSVLICFLSPKS